MKQSIGEKKFVKNRAPAIIDVLIQACKELREFIILAKKHYTQIDLSNYTMSRALITDYSVNKNLLTT